jgi:glycosyltransferase involved in cell wall biosynthesis
VAVSRYVAEDLARVARLPRESITVVYNPVVTPDLEKQMRASLDHPWLRPGMPPVILGVGRLARVKDFSTLLRAFARLRERRIARLVILGEGKELPHLEVLACQLRIDKDVSFSGFVDNPIAFMARARVLALSSVWEGLPSVLIQAMACGCPVVATDCPGGVREIMRDCALGPLVPVGDFEALAAALDEVMQTPAPASLLKARASDFTASLIAHQYLSILLRAACRGRRER